MHFARLQLKSEILFVVMRAWHGFSDPSLLAG
jgi:hypothetical protein